MRISDWSSDVCSSDLQFAPELPGGRDWDDEEGAAADCIIDTVEKHAPGFRASIIAQTRLSPKGLERKFGLVGGDIMHGNMSLDQLWAARPVLGNGGYRGPVKDRTSGVGGRSGSVRVVLGGRRFTKNK